MTLYKASKEESSHKNYYDDNYSAPLRDARSLRYKKLNFNFFQIFEFLPWPFFNGCGTLKKEKSPRFMDTVVFALFPSDIMFEAACSKEAVERNTGDSQVVPDQAGWHVHVLPSIVFSTHEMEWVLHGDDVQVGSFSSVFLLEISNVYLSAAPL